VENAVDDLREALKGKLTFCIFYPLHDVFLLKNVTCILFSLVQILFYYLDPSITLLLRSCRDEPPVVNKVTSDAIISSLVVQPPPKIR